MPYLASPLTLNHEWLAENLRRLHIGMLRELGTPSAMRRHPPEAGSKSSEESKTRASSSCLPTATTTKARLIRCRRRKSAAALGAKIYTIGIGVEEPCRLPMFDVATGKLVLDTNSNVQPTIVLQPANYSVLNKMANLSGRGRIVRRTGGVAEHLRRH